MKLKTNIFLFSLCAYFNGMAVESNMPDERAILDHRTGYLHGVASLTYFASEYNKEQQRQFEENPNQQQLNISDEDFAFLWHKARSHLNQLESEKGHEERLSNFESAYQLYCLTKDEMPNPSNVEALYDLLDTLWQEACQGEISIIKATINHPTNRQKSNHLDNNPRIPSKVKKKFRPYTIPDNHPMKHRLDAIFLSTRATANESAFLAAGFNTFSIGKRSFVHVATHRMLPHYIVKAYLDNDSRKKYDRESWEWLVRRCEGAKKIRSVIQKKAIKHFLIPEKWIYPLPDEPSPPVHKGYVRHYALLLAKDMNLATEDANYHAWKHKITRDHLDELYTIISHARGSSYRPDNIALTKAGKFAFIDTEYPSKGPDYSSIRDYLNREMREYWDKLVKRGGPK